MHYDVISKYYDQLFPLNPDALAFLNSWIGRDDRVLDLGCGTGALVEGLSPKCADIVGIDLDEDMIRCGQEKRPALDLQQGDIRALADDLKDFDVIYSVGNVLSYLTEEELGALCRDVHDRLNPGGRWIYQVVNWDYYARHTTYDFPDKRVGDLTFRRRYTMNPDGAVQFALQLEAVNGLLADELHTLYALSRETHLRLNCRAGFKEESCSLNWKQDVWSAAKAGASILVHSRSKGGVAFANR